MGFYNGVSQSWGWAQKEPLAAQEAHGDPGGVEEETLAPCSLPRAQGPRAGGLHTRTLNHLLGSGYGAAPWPWWTWTAAYVGLGTSGGPCMWPDLDNITAFQSRIFFLKCRPMVRGASLSRMGEQRCPLKEREARQR